MGKGTKGIEELIPLLSDSEAAFGLLSFPVGDSVKFVFLTWVGEKVSFVQQARINVYKAEIMKFAEVRKVKSGHRRN